MCGLLLPLSINLLKLLLYKHITTAWQDNGKKKGLSNRKVAQIMNINRKTVDSYIRRFKVLELDHAELLAMDDAI